MVVGESRRREPVFPAILFSTSSPTAIEPKKETTTTVDQWSAPSVLDLTKKRRMRTETTVGGGFVGFLNNRRRGGWNEGNNLLPSVLFI